MPDETKTSEGKAYDNPADEAGADEVQAKMDEAQEQGYFGEVPDETDNYNYTASGVNEGKPTPETERGEKLLEEQEAKRSKK